MCPFENPNATITQKVAQGFKVVMVEQLFVALVGSLSLELVVEMLNHFVESIHTISIFKATNP